MSLRDEILDFLYQDHTGITTEQLVDGVLEISEMTEIMEKADKWDKFEKGVCSAVCGDYLWKDRAERYRQALEIIAFNPCSTPLLTIEGAQIIAKQALEDK